MAAYDLVVVGGGPAGSTAATLVAKRGHRVCLLEKARFPRYQIGESLLPSTVQVICTMLGVQRKLQAAGFLAKRGGTFVWGRSKSPWTFEFSDSALTQKLGLAHSYQVDRATFDDILLRNAAAKGVDVHEEAQVIGPSWDAAGHRVTGVRWRDSDGREHQCEARHVVDASGRASSLVRHVGERRYSQFFQNVAVFGYFAGGGRLAGEQAGNIFSVAFNEGWAWYIPLRDDLTSVGFVLAREHAPGLRDEARFMQLIADCPPIAKLLGTTARVREGMYGRLRVCNDFSYSNEAFARPGLMLAGDSACFIDPVFSTGVHLATYAGLLAARSVNSCLAGTLSESDAYAVYQARYRREFAAQYRFLVGFYDMNCEREDYFWRARRVLDAGDRGNEAFIRLVAGFGTTGDEFIDRLQGAGAAFETQVASGDSASGTRAVPTPAAFEIERGDGSADDLVPASWRLSGEGGRGARIAGAIVPSDDGMAWARVDGAVALTRDDMLEWADEIESRMVESDDHDVLYLRCRDVEVVFEDAQLIHFGRQLARTREFRAGDTLRWAAYGEFAWAQMQSTLDELIATGVLTMASRPAK